MDKAQTQAELNGMISRIEEVQRARKLSDTNLVNEYPDLGSPKTWTDRLRPRKWGELKLEKWHKRLTRIMKILDGGLPDETYFPEISFHRNMVSRLATLERQTNDRRILVCLAANGCGKSAFGRWAVAQKSSTRAMVRMRPSYRNKPIHIYKGIGAALDNPIATSNVAEAEDAVIKELRSKPRTLFLDQAHEAGVVLMHILRALVDETPSRFVYLAYDTAWRQVMSQSTDAQIEAQAFIGRCLKPIFDLYKYGTRARDIALYLRLVGGLDEPAARSLAAVIEGTLQASTNLRLLDDAIQAAVWEADNDEPTPEAIELQITALSGIKNRRNDDLDS